MLYKKRSAIICNSTYFVSVNLKLTRLDKVIDGNLKSEFFDSVHRSINSLGNSRFAFTLIGEIILYGRISN